mgnify:CR=1 FL=1
MIKSVLLGFSGGIDSQTAARMLTAEGYRVVLATIDTTGDAALIEKAERMAKELNLEWHLIDKRKEFGCDIIDYFCSEYGVGHTPAPCTRCNTHIKWNTLEEVADSLGIEYIATGHYFSVTEHNNHLYVTKGVDPAKDQSYYLWGLKQSTLRRAITPMGRVIKSEVKERFLDKSESMGICFLKGMHYVDFLKDRGVAVARGNVVNRKGELVGEHSGIACYTIGQRRGEGIPEGFRVVDIDAKNNNIIVGSRDELDKKWIHIDRCNIVDINELLSATDITVKIRGIGLNPQEPVMIEPHDDGYIIKLRDPAWAPAKGQPLVIYRNNLVIGGGIVVDFG